MNPPEVVWNPFTGNLEYAGVSTVSPAIPYPGGVSQWVPVSTTSVNMLANTGYVVGPISLCTLTLPVSCTFGTVFRVVGLTGGWKIQLNGGQQIIIGDETTMAGGFIQSTNIKDAVEILCIGADTFFQIISGAQGNITIN